jgi:hypothetical protein
MRFAPSKLGQHFVTSLLWPIDPIRGPLIGTAAARVGESLLLQTGWIRGRSDRRWRQPEQDVSLGPVVAEGLRGAAERRAVEGDIVVGEADYRRSEGILDSNVVAADHAVAEVYFRAGACKDTGLSVP